MYRSSVRTWLGQILGEQFSSHLWQAGVAFLSKQYSGHLSEGFSEAGWLTSWVNNFDVICKKLLRWD